MDMQVAMTAVVVGLHAEDGIRVADEVLEVSGVLFRTVSRRHATRHAVWLGCCQIARLDARWAALSPTSAKRLDLPALSQLGTASCRARVCQYVTLSVVTRPL